MTSTTTTTKQLNHRQSMAEKQWREDQTSIIDILHKDHLKVTDMFFQYEELEDKKEKQILVQKILQALFIHSTIEENIVYPNVRKDAAKNEETDDLMDESETEHHLVKVLMFELSTMQPDGEFYDAKVCVLGELVRHHVREEEKYMFAKMKEADMYLEKLGQKCMAKKEDLQMVSTDEISVLLEQQLQEWNAEVTKKRRKYD